MTVASTAYKYDALTYCATGAPAKKKECAKCILRGRLPFSCLAIVFSTASKGMIINFWRYDSKITAKMAIVYVNNQTELSSSKSIPVNHVVF